MMNWECGFIGVEGEMTENPEKLSVLRLLISISCYVFGPDGLTKSRHCNADNENFLEGLYIDSGLNRSVGYGFATFFESTKVEWNEWVINNKLHLFLIIEPNFVSGNS